MFPLTDGHLSLWADLNSLECQNMLKWHGNEQRTFCVVYPIPSALHNVRTEEKLRNSGYNNIIARSNTWALQMCQLTKAFSFKIQREIRQTSGTINWSCRSFLCLLFCKNILVFNTFFKKIRHSYRSNVGLTVKIRYRKPFYTYKDRQEIKGRPSCHKNDK